MSGILGTKRQSVWSVMFFFSLLIVALLVAAPQAARAETYSGTSGTVEWEIDDEGTLTFRPTNGVEGSFEGSGLKWVDFSNTSGPSSIKAVAFEGVCHATGNLSFMFSGFDHVKTIDFTGLETSGVTGMSRMFSGCSGLESLDLTDLDTSNVTAMWGMFSGCSLLTSLDLSGWDTSNVTDMSGIFYGCSSLTSLDLSSWDTSSVTDMSDMFWDCSGITSLDLSDWDTSNVTNMNGMFRGCTSLPSLDLSNFDTSSVVYMGQWYETDRMSGDKKRWGTGMFQGCSSLVSLDLSSWNTSKVTAMGEMFSGCSSLSSLNLSGWDTSALQCMSHMFEDCHKLSSLDVAHFDVSNVTYMDCVFFDCEALTSLNLSSWDTSNVTDMTGMFIQCNSLRSIGLSGWDTSNVTDMDEMFFNCVALINLDLAGWNVSKVTNMDAMFQQCYSLESIDLSGWDISSVTDMDCMFQNCPALTSVDISGWDASRVESNDSMFMYCSGLGGLGIPSGMTVLGKSFLLNTSSQKTGIESISIPKSVTTIGENAFSGCKSLADVYYAGSEEEWSAISIADGNECLTNATIHFNSDGSKLYSGTWGTCDWFVSMTGRLTVGPGTGADTGGTCPWAQASSKIRFASFDNVVAPVDVSRLFSGCSSLRTLDLSSFDTSNVTSMDSMFSGCSSLTTVALGSAFSFCGLGSTRLCSLPEGGWYSSADGVMYAADEVPNNVAARYTRYSSSTVDGSVSIRYGESDYEVFEHPLEWYLAKSRSTTYSPKLAHMCSALAVSAYTKDYIVESYESLGFDDSNILVGYYDRGDDLGDLAAFTLGVKEISDGSKLVLLTVRGTMGGGEWLSNFTIQPVNEFGACWHYGFQEAANSIYDVLSQKLGGIPTDGVTYVVTGHSRGAAVSNIIETKLAEDGVPQSNVYGYNIACPDTATGLWTGWNSNGEHDNMFNIGNRQDPVTYVPGKVGDLLRLNIGTSWGKYGRSIWFCEDWNDVSYTGLDASVHDQHVYLAHLREEPSLDSFKSWVEVRANSSALKVVNAMKAFAVFCPVDVTVRDAAGNVVASVVGDVADYHGSEFGKVIVFVSGDKKLIAVPAGEEYTVELVGTGEGSMTMEVSDLDLFSDEPVDSKAFSNVALEEGKRMTTAVGADEAASQVRLSVVDDAGNVTTEVSTDGTEKPLASFVDVTALTAHYEDISWMAEQGISQGWTLEDGTREFRPYANIARADMAAFLHRLAGSPAAPGGSSISFRDVDSAVAHEGDIGWLAATGISEGWELADGSREFHPYANIARADMAAFLYRLAGSPAYEAPAISPFTDVTTETAHYKEICWLASTGVSEGWRHNDGTAEFRPFTSIARADAAAFLHRMSDKGLVASW